MQAWNGDNSASAFPQMRCRVLSANYTGISVTYARMSMHLVQRAAQVCSGCAPYP